MAALPNFGCTCARMRKLTRRLTRIYDAHLAAQAIKVTQYSLLVNTARGERTLTEFAAELEMDRSTLSRNLAPLAAQGWVEIAVGTDPRSRSIRITATGRRKLKSALPLWRKAQCEIESALGAKNVGELHQEIERALAVLPTRSGKRA
ncbi:MAG TPA: MarR family winged helix-turn-helix transcriptional regulator [Burkholderiales bacterium]|nr:MarR family winged helix-turn-helix transcriptional regulator [Burkholderiales bacterium]